MNPFESIRLRRQIEVLRPRLYRLAYGWCRDPHTADDLVQDTLERALSRLSNLGWRSGSSGSCTTVTST